MMKLSALIAAIAVSSALAATSYAQPRTQPRSDTLELAPPDFVAGVLGKLTVAVEKCGLQTNSFPLKLAVAKLGWNLDDFWPDDGVDINTPPQRYFYLVERAVYQAIDQVGLSASEKARNSFWLGSALGQPQACAAIKAQVAQSLPDIIAR
jgi:hypothetical protein